MKFLIVGLGNVGDKYVDTRHNIGFKVVEAFAEQHGASFELDKQAYKAEVKAKGRTFVLIKPTTFMNLSGKALNYWMQAEKIPQERVLVITDDLALPFGKIRMRKKGSDGGHNGLKDINQVLGNTNYVRIRFGIGNEFSKGHQVNYVLGDWSPEELKVLPERIKVMCEAILAFGTIGPDRAMNAYNNK